MTADTSAAFEALLRSSHPHRADDGVWEIALHLLSVRDAFATTVPVPLPYATIDPDVADYIEDRLGGIAENERVRLAVHLPAEKIDGGSSALVSRVFSAYIAERIGRHKKFEREALGDMIKAVGWGFSFMLGCQALRWLLNFPEHPTLTQTFSEGLLVLGWVALWNPYDRFLFGWLPAVKRRRLVERLLSIEVVVRPMPEELAAALQAGAGQKIRRSRPEQEAGSGR